MTSPLYRNDRPGHYPESWYAATADLQPERAPLLGETRADVCVIGAGFTGLTAALHLAERGFDVVVVEAHRVGFGASGRNGGQVGSGFNKDQIWLSEKLGPGPARHLWDLAEEAKELVRGLAAKHAPEARYTPGVAHGDWTLAGTLDLHNYADWLSRHYGYEVHPLDRIAFQELCRSEAYQGGILDMGAGHIHPLRYAFGLARAAEAAGARIYERTEAHDLEDNVVRTGQGRVLASHIIVAGNGYLPHLNRTLTAKVMPINSFIAATEPLGDRADTVLTRDVAVADDRFVVNYFRLSEDKRLLFGGRESYTLGFPTDILTALRKRMIRLFPQLAGVRIDYHWGGTLGITMSRLPLVARLGPTTLTASGFSGHGVALTAIAGKVMAEAVAGQSERFDTLADLPVPAFPGGGFGRAPLLALAMTWYALRDRLGH